MHRYLLRIMRKFLPAFLLMVFFITDSLFTGESFAQAPDGAQLFQPCTACHTIGKGKLVGPDLYQVTKERDRAWLHKFIKNSQEVVKSGDPYAVKLFETYNKVPMPPFAYTDEQIDAVLDYIEHYDINQAAAPATGQEEAAPGVEESKEAFYAVAREHRHQYRTTFLISLVLLLVALFDLLVTKLIKAHFVNIIIILISASVMIEITVVEAQNLGRQPDYSPDQPIKFSHRVHAGDNRIDCKYCHTGVTVSRFAGIPSMNVCMNCHNVVRQGRYTGTEEIEKIFKSIESGKPVHWIQVYNLPDHTYFNHAQHVVVGKVACETCHGDVKTMDRIKVEQPLAMGWCINCHRKTEVQFKDNAYYDKFVKLHDELASGNIDKITVNEVGGTECSKCHY